MSPKKARTTTVKKLITVLMRRLSEYETYFRSLAEKGKKPDNQAVSACRHLIHLIHEIEFINDLGEAEADKRAQDADSSDDVLSDVYGIDSMPLRRPEAKSPEDARHQPEATEDEGTDKAGDSVDEDGYSGEEGE